MKRSPETQKEHLRELTKQEKFDFLVDIGKPFKALVGSTEFVPVLQNMVDNEEAVVVDAREFNGQSSEDIYMSMLKFVNKDKTKAIIIENFSFVDPSTQDSPFLHVLRRNLNEFDFTYRSESLRSQYGENIPEEIAIFVMGLTKFKPFSIVHRVSQELARI